MSDDPKEYEAPDPYLLKLDEAQDILNEIQSILWYDDEGKIAADKEWTSDTLEKIANALKSLEPKQREMVPMRWVKYTVSLVVPADSGAVTPRKLAEYLLVSELHRERGEASNGAYALHARKDRDHPISAVELSTLLVRLGYDKDHFEKE